MLPDAPREQAALGEGGAGQGFYVSGPKGKGKGAKGPPKGKGKPKGKFGKARGMSLDELKAKTTCAACWSGGTLEGRPPVQGEVGE